MNKSAINAPIDEMSFEAAMQELEVIVKQMESGQTALENSIQAYERGVKLKKHCETKLKEAQSKIEKITMDDEGKIQASPFEQQE